MRTIRSRVIILAAVVAASLWVIYPPKETIKLGLDLNGGVHLVLRVKTDEALQLDTHWPTVEQARQTIERRVNELGVAEAVVARYTEHDQILVELPGVADVDRAKQIIKSTAQLRLTLVERGPFPDREAALQSYDNALPPTLEVLPGPSRDTRRGRDRLLRRPEGAGRLRQRPARCAPVGRRVQPPGGQLHA